MSVVRDYDYQELEKSQYVTVIDLSQKINIDMSARTFSENFMYVAYFKLLVPSPVLYRTGVPSCIPFGNKRICKKKKMLFESLSFLLPYIVCILFI